MNGLIQMNRQMALSCSSGTVTTHSVFIVLRSLATTAEQKRQQQQQMTKQMDERLE